MVAPAGCILHATSSTGTGGRATSAQAQALCRDAPPSSGQSHAHTHCCTVARSWSRTSSQNLQSALLPKFRKPGRCKLQQLQLAPTDGRTPPTFACVWTLHRKLQHPCIRTCSPATALPCLAQWGSRQTIASLHRCTLCCVEDKAERHPLLASPLTPPPAPQMTWCTILCLLANAQDAQATSEIRKWTFAEVLFFRGAQLQIRDVVG